MKDQGQINCENKVKMLEHQRRACPTHLGCALGLKLGELDGSEVLGMALGLPLGELDGSEVLGVALQ